MAEYLVLWRVTVEARSPLLAALLAQDCTLDNVSHATVFEVFPSHSCLGVAIDLGGDVPHVVGDVVRHMQTRIP